MSTPALSRRAPKPPYEDLRDPDGRSWTVREDLSDILQRELLGPANGDEEVLDGPPDAAYLIRAHRTGGPGGREGRPGLGRGRRGALRHR